MSESIGSTPDEIPSFEALQKDPIVADQVITKLYAELEADGTLAWIMAELDRESSLDPVDAAPGQGLVVTGYEGDDPKLHFERVALSEEIVKKTIHAWLYYLELFNHPDRLKYLFAQSEVDFIPPKARFHPLFFLAKVLKRAVTINDLKLNASGSRRARTQRTQAHKESLFVSYGRGLSFMDRVKQVVTKGTLFNRGRKQARNVVVGAANPEITGSPMALASLAQAHSLVCVPRDGFFSDIKRQVALIEKTYEWLQHSPVLKGKKEPDKAKLLDFWKHNLVGVIEAEPTKALKRAEALYAAGIRTFRIYSPEPSSAPLETLKRLRAMEKDKHWEPIEIFVGQVVDVKQAQELEAAGANALYFGIGGGGRCITGVVAGLTINWPELIWQLRGKIKIPMIVEGGANDHMPESLAIGVSGIGTAGKFGGTIETPGGYLFLIDENGQLFKYYGGEASDRMRIMGGRNGPLEFVLNEEGETRHKGLRNGGHDRATLLQVLYEQHQGIVAGLVFQNARSISEFQQLAAEELRQASPHDDVMRHTH